MYDMQHDLKIVHAFFFFFFSYHRLHYRRHGEVCSLEISHQLRAAIGVR